MWHGRDENWYWINIHFRIRCCSLHIFEVHFNVDESMKLNYYWVDWAAYKTCLLALRRWVLARVGIWNLDRFSKVINLSTLGAGNWNWIDHILKKKKERGELNSQLLAWEHNKKLTFLFLLFLVHIMCQKSQRAFSMTTSTSLVVCESGFIEFHRRKLNFHHFALKR